MSSLSRGDVVQLKSGSPDMTVNDVGYDGGQVMCCWFVKSEEVKQQLFSPEALKKIR